MNEPQLNKLLPLIAHMETVPLKSIELTCRQRHRLGRRVCWRATVMNVCGVFNERK